MKLKALKRIMQDAKKVAQQYRNLTGKPLGITGEMGELTAANLLKLKLKPARQPGYDAISRNGRRIQIKTRCVLPNSKKSQRIGTIRLNQKCDEVVLVLLDEYFEPIEIYKANYKSIQKELIRPGSEARNKRGQLSTSAFKRIAGKHIWP
ncbi:MAG: hypothetical protein A2Z15_01825 [Chloroflexi bacterium RBG_16_50_11]|nr:MAG: hypothetical protein A2Z15_01825 [Chloroflexi bacterium RBG_16_50_11]